MRNLPWIVASIGAGIALCLLWSGRNRRYQAAGASAIDEAADAVVEWGAKQRVAGAAKRTAGRLKKNLGRIAGNDDLADQGAATQAAGVAIGAAGTLAQAAGETIHDLKR